MLININFEVYSTITQVDLLASPPPLPHSHPRSERNFKNEQELATTRNRPYA